MKTNESILAQETISYNDIKLLKNRSNKDGKDVISYESFKPIQIDSDGGDRELKWLKSLLTSKGKPRKGTRLSRREIDIIQHATNEDFEFIGFYDNGGFDYRNYKPIYKVGGMVYAPNCIGRKILYFRIK